MAGNMDYEKTWKSLKTSLIQTMDEMKQVRGGRANYDKTRGVELALDMMDDYESGRLSPVNSTRDREDRVVHATGVEHGVPYEVVRYAKAKEYWVEHSNGFRRKVSVATAVELAQEPKLGQPGGSKFDREYQKAQEEQREAV